MAQVKINSHGSDAVVVLPDAFLESLGPQVGDTVEATVFDRHLVLSPLDGADRRKLMEEIMSDVFRRRKDAFERLA